MRQFLGILRARRKFVVVTLGLGALLTTGVILAIAPTYSSTSTLYMSTPSTGVADTYPQSSTAGQRAQSYADLARGPEVLQRVSERVDAGLSVSDLADQVETSVVEKTLLLRVDATAGSPELARRIASVEAEEIIRLVENLETPSDEEIPAPIIALLADKASFNPNAVAPNLPLGLGVGLLLSLVVGVAGAVLRDLLDTSVKTSEDVESMTSNAVMATLPYDPVIKKQPLCIEDGGGALAEAFRVLRTNLQFSNLDATRQTILVTSAIPDEGKTFVAANLAIAMAKSGRSVLLVDADFRNPGVADLLGLENSVGTITVLLGRASLEQATQEHVSGVSFLATGPKPPNPSEVLDTRAMRDLMSTIRAEYDVVIFDAPPILPVADAAILLTEVDGALLLTRYGSTSREHLRQAVLRIETVGGRLFGTVLNRTPRKALDGYGYGYGYGYGSTPEPARPRTDRSETRVRDVRSGRRVKR
ncbi:polysaccharide biosynthesis tyrosine autokinase [Aeromicrobium sp.]|uniref:polysaccharide biosynthesis tyrosine autokinase n=1 Tax=Aeromicrobium sp. TaxID=1871063 RepID=UPI003D6BCFE1